MDTLLGGTHINLRGFSDWNGERAIRMANHPGLCSSYGIGYLDDALGSITNNDLILIGARTGVGKTEMVTKLAYQNAAVNKKRVLLFALEASDWEIHQRILYRAVAEEFYRNNSQQRLGIRLNYKDWINGKILTEVKDLEEKHKNILASKLMTLDIIYVNGGEFNMQHLGWILEKSKDNTDLIIIDHLHYFDFDGINENKEVRDIVKRIRDLAIYYSKPVVLVSHLRKKDRGMKTIVPDIDDFHGTSEIVKRATKVITFAGYNQDDYEPWRFPTLFRVSKNRTDGSVTRFVGKHVYNIKINDYEKSYEIGRLVKNETEWEKIEDFKNYPYWAVKEDAICKVSKIL